MSRLITPEFTISQDNDFVTVTIKVPHVRAQNAEMFIDGNEFRFSLSPYFLRQVKVLVMPMCSHQVVLINLCPWIL